MAATKVRVNRGVFLSWLQTFIQQEEKEKQRSRFWRSRRGFETRGSSCRRPTLHRCVRISACVFGAVSLPVPMCLTGILCWPVYAAVPLWMCVFMHSCVHTKGGRRCRPVPCLPSPTDRGKRTLKSLPSGPDPPAPFLNQSFSFLITSLGLSHVRGLGGGGDPGGWLEEAELRIRRREERERRGRQRRRRGLCTVCTSGYEGMCECVQVRVCVSVCR